MSRRMLPLLVVAILLIAAPAAMASHCDRCFVNRQTFETYCGPAVSFAGYTWCTDLDGTCMTSGVLCTPHAFAPELQLASEFRVVSVERLEEPRQPAAEQPQIAAVR
jgi:hypothetical protein